MNHARTLGYAAHGAGNTADVECHCNLFLLCIRGHYRLRGVFAVVAQTVRQGVHAVCDGRYVERLTNDTRRRDYDVVTAYAEFCRGQFAHLVGNLHPVCIAGVGVAAVAYHSLCVAVGYVFSRHFYGGAVHKVGCVNRRRCGSAVAHYECQVPLFPVFADAAVHSVCLESLCGAHAARYDFYHCLSPLIY